MRHGRTGVFHGLLGVALTVNDPKDFKKKYDKVMENFFEKFKQYRKKKVYKSSEIGSLFPGRRDRVMAAYRYLARSLLKIEDVRVNVYYLTLNLKELRKRKETSETVQGQPSSEEVDDSTEASEKPEEKEVEQKLITIYGERGREGAQEISVSDFFKKIMPYYPIICAWKLCSFLKLWNVEIVLDGCKGEKSHAWEELISNCQKVTIAFGGDSYNPFVSSADLLVKWIDEELRESGLPLNQSALVRVLTQWTGVTDDLDKEQVHIVHLGNKDLKDIQPLSKEKIDAFENIYARHPIVFIFREELNSPQRLEIEESPLMNKIHDLIYFIDGSLIWWDPKEHTKLIQKDDIAIVFGNKGLEEAQFLNKLGNQLKILKVENINGALRTVSKQV
jgi:hypothetical protein